MATISFPNGQDIWLATRWVYGNFLDRVLSDLDGDPMRGAVEEGIAFENIDFASLDEASVSRLAHAMLAVARDIGQGRLAAQNAGRDLDGTSQEQFRRKVAELEGMLARIVTTPRSPAQ